MRSDRRVRCREGFRRLRREPNDALRGRTTFEIIGEALIGLLRVAPELTQRLSDTRRIIAFRNRLIHGYASVADEVVWGVVETNLPVLRREVAELIAEG